MTLTMLTMTASFLANLFAGLPLPVRRPSAMMTMTCSCSSASFSYRQLPVLAPLPGWDFEEQQLRSFL